MADASGNTLFSDLEDKLIAVECELRRCTTEELLKIVQKLTEETGDLTGKRKIELVRMIVDVFDGETEPEKMGGQMLSLLPLVPARLMAPIADILIKGTAADDSTMEGNQMESSFIGNFVQNNPSTFRKDLKISGQIGSSSKDSLNYISLCSQITDARRKKYKDQEITQAVKRAVSPGDKLRTYLDSKPDLTLDEVLNFVRSCLREKPANELFKDLNSLHQHEHEDAQSFVMRALERRQQVLIASEAEGAKYDEELLRTQFFHTVRTGLRNSCIKARIEPLVRRDAKTADHVLMSELSLIAAEEQESTAKRMSNGSYQVGNLSTTAHPENGCSTGGDGQVRFQAQGPWRAVESCGMQQPPESPLLSGMREITDQVLALKKEVQQLKSSRERNLDHQPAGNKQNRGGTVKVSVGCPSCRADNTVSRCKHCWMCGSSDHFLRECPSN